MTSLLRYLGVHCASHADDGQARRGAPDVFLPPPLLSVLFSMCLVMVGASIQRVPRPVWGGKREEGPRERGKEGNKRPMDVLVHNAHLPCHGEGDLDRSAKTLPLFPFSGVLCPGHLLCPDKAPSGAGKSDTQSRDVSVPLGGKISYKRLSYRRLGNYEVPLCPSHHVPFLFLPCFCYLHVVFGLPLTSEPVWC